MSFKIKYKRVGYSFIAFISLMTSASAGVITTQAQAYPSVSDGFGGWNLGNVDVVMTDIDYIPTSKTFFPLDGSYDTMVVGDSFESLVKDDTGTLMGKLHGKDWPVGEPPGVRVLKDIPGMTNGKPGNCIMTTSYLEGSYLDAATPVPTDCASPFQSHKRFKVNLQPSLVDGVGAESVDMVFNVEPELLPLPTRRYQVFQKINNYTNSRLKGYSLQLGFGVGSAFVEATEYADLTLSVGIGEDLTGDTIEDIWSESEMAAFAHGLWGPVDKHFPDPGFFSPKGAGYLVDLNDTKKSLSTGASLDSLGSNYETLFGEWLPSIWAPSGIFWDDDADPTTDAQLMAFWADVDGDGTYAWTSGGPAFDLVDPVVVNGWAADPLYSLGKIEDVLNLGLNYIVNVGDVSTFGDYNGTAATFTIRITPNKADVDQTEPGWMSNPPVFKKTNPAVIMYLLD